MSQVTSWSWAQVLVLAVACALVWHAVLYIVRLAAGSGRGGVLKTPQAVDIGDITAEELEKYGGHDPFLPVLLAVRGRIFDVTDGRRFYGPGGPYAVYAGHEVARGLALMSLKPEDRTEDVSDLTEKQLGTLADWISKFEAKYPVVGQIVASKELTLQELERFTGAQPGEPIYLAVRGTVFDVTAGRDFYGPDGAYPFAGRECARALAKFSTDTADCNDDISDCSIAEKDALRDWEGRFYSKYKVVGKIVSSKN